MRLSLFSREYKNVIKKYTSYLINIITNINSKDSRKFSTLLPTAFIFSII